MALLDMSEVITDPDFAEPADALTLERNVQTIDGGGMATNTPTLTPFSAVVCARDGSRMTRSEDGEMVESSLSIHTLTHLTAGSPPDVPADVVQWKGARYTVANTNDYSHFGAGFVQADLELLPVAGD